MSNKILYDINYYSDSEIFDLLDLVNPSDRVLEAKIIQMIKKYQSADNETGQKLTEFFKKVYDRFFFTEDFDADIPEKNETQEPIVEGMENTPYTVATVDNLPEIKPDTTPITTTANNQQQITLTRQTEYKKDNLNPLLKQTIKRIISIDSQYRDKKYTYSTDFTFNLSEPLRDVVALRLYSVQIPYTWYTINTSYGGNYLYLKGVSPGIDNGNFDYKIEVLSGNYSPSDLVTAVNNSLQLLKTQQIDVSFGDTVVTYNSASNLSTFKIDITNIFNENNYEITFENNSLLNTYPLSVDASGNALRYEDNRQTSNLSAFLGFNYLNYSPKSVYSERRFPISTSSASNSDITLTIYNLDSTNNYFTIYQYIGPEAKDSYDNSNTIYSKKIQLTLPDGKYSRHDIFTDLSNAIQNTSELMNSFIVQHDILYNNTDPSGNNYIIENDGYSYYNLTIELKKYINANLQNIKTVVVFPEETDPNSRIWVSDPTINNCCFYFMNRINELSVIKAESVAKQSSYIIKTNPYIIFKCIAPGYDTPNNGTYNGTYWQTHDNSFNDYRIDISNNTDLAQGYNLTEYVVALNNSIVNTNNKYGIFNTNITKFSENVSNNLSFKIDINKQINTDNYYIDFSGTVLYYLLGLGATVGTTGLKENREVINSSVTVEDIPSRISLNRRYTFTATTSLLYNYSIDFSKNIVRFGPNGESDANRNADKWVLKNDKISTESFSNNIQFTNKINSLFTNFTDSEGSYPLVGSKLNINIINGQLQSTLTIQINKVLTQNDYELYFYDQHPTPSITSIVSSDFGFDTSYNLKLLHSPEVSYSEITGTKRLSLNNFYLEKETYFNITPISNRINIGNKLNNNISPIKISITPNVDFSGNICSLGQVLNTINIQLEKNTVTKGSTIYNKQDSQGNNYVYLKLNINKIYSTNDYKIVFYDYTSFVKCYLGIVSVKNVTWDSTLGWILGFHSDTEYSLKEYTATGTNTALLVGDTTIITNLYNYFLIILDDYTQSHLNDGLVTLTPQQTEVALPSYASKSHFTCDENGNKVFTGNGGGGLTQNQIYSANQIYLSQKAKIKTFSIGPYKQDIFGLIPIKVSGLANGSYYVEFGGTLQNQERIYFGPVNITRMSIKLINDKGEIVDLNNSNWSFSFICEQLYQQNTV